MESNNLGAERVFEGIGRTPSVLTQGVDQSWCSGDWRVGPQGQGLLRKDSVFSCQMQVCMEGLL